MPHPVKAPSSGFAFDDYLPGISAMSGRLRQTVPLLRRGYEGSRLEAHWIVTAYGLVVPIRISAELPGSRPRNAEDSESLAMPIAVHPTGDKP